MNGYSASMQSKPREYSSKTDAVLKKVQVTDPKGGVRCMACADCCRSTAAPCPMPYTACLLASRSLPVSGKGCLSKSVFQNICRPKRLAQGLGGGLTQSGRPAARHGVLAQTRVHAPMFTAPALAAPRLTKGAYRPNSSHKAWARACTAASITMGRPHSRCVSPGHLLVASSPILLPSPLTGEAKSR